MAVIADMAVVVAFHFHDHMSIELSGFHLENFSLGEAHWVVDVMCALIRIHSN